MNTGKLLIFMLTCMGLIFSSILANHLKDKAMKKHEKRETNK